MLKHLLIFSNKVNIILIELLNALKTSKFNIY